jgi:hypothetical protein
LSVALPAADRINGAVNFYSTRDRHAYEELRRRAYREQRALPQVAQSFLDEVTTR